MLDLVNLADQPDESLVLRFRCDDLGQEVFADGHEIVTMFRRLTGADDQVIQDHMFSWKGKGKAGKAVMNSGQVERLKVCRSVTSIEGLCFAGKPIQRVDNDVYAKLPRWMVERYKAFIRTINNEETGEDEDDSGN